MHHPTGRDGGEHQAKWVARSSQTNVLSLTAAKHQQFGRNGVGNMQKRHVGVSSLYVKSSTYELV